MSRAVLLQTQQQLCRACSTCGKTAAGDGSPKQVCISNTQAFTFDRNFLVRHRVLEGSGNGRLVPIALVCWKQV